MIIKKLFLTSFGKFENYEVDFTKGVNVIYGLNEAGKSTIHKFIEGMFFGFMKPGGKRKTYLSEHARYKPRGKKEYYGSMIIEQDGIEYFLTRDFDRNNPSVTLQNNVTGKDMTKSLDIDSSTRLPDVAQFFHLDFSIYRNTLSIEQLKSDTFDDNTPQILVEKLTNLATSKDEAISIIAVNDVLKKRSDEIGKESQKTKPYYQKSQLVTELQTELQQSKQQYETMNTFASEYYKIGQTIQSLEQRIEEMKRQEIQYENELKKEKYLVVKQIDEERTDIQKKMSNIQQYQHVSEEDYSTAVIANKTYLESKEQLDIQLKQLLEIQEKRSDLEQQMESFPLFKDGVSYQDIYEDIQQFQSLKNDIQSIKEAISSIQKEEKSFNETNRSIKDDYVRYITNIERMNHEDEDHKQNKSDLQFQLHSLQQSRPSKGTYVFAICLIPIIIGVFWVIALRKKQRELDGLISDVEQKIRIEEECIQSKNEETKQLLAINTQLLEKHHVLNKVELQLKYEKYMIHEASINELRDQLKSSTEALQEKELAFTSMKETVVNILTKANFSEMTENVLPEIKASYQSYVSTKQEFQMIQMKEEQIQHRVADLENKITTSKRDMKRIFEQNSVTSLSELQDAIEKLHEYNDFVKQEQFLNQRLKDAIGFVDIQEFESEIDFNSVVTYDKEIHNSLSSKIDIDEKELREQIKRHSTLQQQITQIESGFRHPDHIEKELQYQLELLDEMKSEYQAIQTAMEVIMELSNEISYEFAPTLNHAISTMIETVTKGAYSNVKIDRNMNMLVFDKKHNMNVDVKEFSRGTIDQIYVSLRFAVNELVGHKNHPIIMDDAFVNYDDQRIQTIIDILVERVAKSKQQVLLFTCQSREKEYLEQENREFNLIEL